MLGLQAAECHVLRSDRYMLIDVLMLMGALDIQRMILILCLLHCQCKYVSLFVCEQMLLIALQLWIGIK